MEPKFEISMLELQSWARGEAGLREASLRLSRGVSRFDLIAD
jgi:hypothetical protein